MTSLLLLIASLIVFAIAAYLFKIGNLLDTLSQKPTEGKDPKTNHQQAVLFLILTVVGFVLFFSYAYQAAEKYILPQAAVHLSSISSLFWITMTLILVVFVLTHVVLFFFAYKYRYRPGRKAYFHHDNHKLEILWTLVPAVVLSVLIFKGLSYWQEITAPAPENAEVVELSAYQFAWASRYPGKDGKLGRADFKLIDSENRTGVDFRRDENAQDDFMPRVMHLPKGKPVKIRIRALDVIHSFYAPHFGAQTYAIPGMPTVFWFTPSKTTNEMREELKDPDFNYEIACNKICGRGHFSMRYILVVDEPEEYEEWYTQQSPWIQKHPEYLSPKSREEPLSQKSNNL
ncbi:MAG: cytochrome c oxidase subunit II [Cytophagales bacterium]|nr:cytochrome c oxidase subunit II [Cytophagales bacterium]